ncbi:hypothetical protein HBI51_132510 [Parastagonospora nodorum]|nr:hypothetical protein HBI51_132510 [Parastagonospora nodorum]
MSDTSNSTDSTEDARNLASRLSADVAEKLFQHLSNSTFACGGTVKTSPPGVSATETTHDGKDAPKPDTTEEALIESVTIRWDSTTSIEKLVLPLAFDSKTKEPSPIAKLVAGTQPASFGLQGKDVIDESYRKASKLDTSAFSTNFCPYATGIIDVVGQTLLPKLPSSVQGIRAELYKLNIYQAPSGFFKAHVDTPRSELQFGSLVVCLPCDHEGGQLVVRHQGQATTFDWSGPGNDIKWAAFYSDCEHEVLEVTSGYRITLTYNLYMRRGLGEIAGLSQTLDAQQLPAYKEIKDALANPDFMNEGGMLGKYCSHAYAHAIKNAESVFPSVLKGSDMVAYEVFRSLGVKVLVRPVVDHISKHLDHEDIADMGMPELFTHSHIGKELSAPINTNTEWGEGGDVVDVYQAYPNTLMKVTWMNAPVQGTQNMQFAYLIYGNQAEADFEYSFCALLFEIPSYTERVKLAEKHGYVL